MSPLVDDLAVPLGEDEASRRKFLGLVGAGALAVAGLGTVITGVRFLYPAVVLEGDSRFPVGRPEDFAVGAVVVLPKQKVYVVRGPEGFVALSAVCTHLGCMTRYEAESARIFCPCHGSQFALTGKVTGGPAPRPLLRLGLAVEQGQLVVDVKTRVADDFVLVVS